MQEHTKSNPLYKWLNISYKSAGNLLSKLNYQKKTVATYKCINEQFNGIKDSLDEVNQVSSFLAIVRANTISTDLNGSLSAQKMSEVVGRIAAIEKNLLALSSVYHNHNKVIGNISNFTESVLTTDDDLRKSIELEAHTRSTDFQHKMNLTALRIVQIPAFIFVTYFSVHLAVNLIGEKDLVIPRGLISIVPSSLEKNAQNLAIPSKVSDNISSKPSATPEATKNTKSVTDSVASASLKTEP